MVQRVHSPETRSASARSLSIATRKASERAHSASLTSSGSSPVGRWTTRSAWAVSSSSVKNSEVEERCCWTHCVLRGMFSTGLLLPTQGLNHGPGECLQASSGAAHCCCYTYQNKFLKSS